MTGRVDHQTNTPDQAAAFEHNQPVGDYQPTRNELDADEYQAEHGLGYWAGREHR